MNEKFENIKKYFIKKTNIQKIHLNHNFRLNQS